MSSLEFPKKGNYMSESTSKRITQKAKYTKNVNTIEIKNYIKQRNRLINISQSIRKQEAGIAYIIKNNKSTLNQVRKIYGRESSSTFSNSNHSNSQRDPSKSKRKVCINNFLNKC